MIPAPPPLTTAGVRTEQQKELKALRERQASKEAEHNKAMADVAKINELCDKLREELEPPPKDMCY